MNLDARILEPVVRSAVAKEPKGRFVAVREETPPNDPFDVTVDGAEWLAVPVRSTLQARRVMSMAGDEGRRILLTSILEDELGEEVVARLAQHQVHRIEPWQLVRSAFDAQSIDPRVRAESWIAQALLERRPPGGYPRVPAGTLDLDTAWNALWREMGLVGEPTAHELLAACADGTLGGPWSVISSDFQEGLRRRMRMKLGALGGAIAALLDHQVSQLAITYGLIADALNGRAPDDLLVVKAVDRMEQQLGLKEGGHELGALARTWCDERIQSNRLDVLDAVFEETVKRASTLIDREILSTSAVHPDGVLARERALGDAIQSLIASPSEMTLADRVEAAAQDLLQHRLVLASPRYREHRAAIENARRLGRWLSSADQTANSLGELATAYRDDGAWADRARYGLGRGHGSGELQSALSALGAAVRDRREGQSRAFAERLEAVVAGREGAGEVRPIEHVYRELVAPLARQAPVLVVVLDGMSQAAFQQIARDIQGRTSLTRMAPTSERSLRPIIAALPTVTEVARASLLCGELTSGGTASVERNGQAALAAEFGWDQGPSDLPTLFHKGTLMHSGGGLAPEVRAAIDSDHRVVTVIINAIDDMLPKGDQIQLDWSLGTLPELRGLLLDEGAVARAVVLTSDHGHVVELWEGEAESGHVGEKGERWRAPGRELDSREALFEGTRVMLPSQGGPVVLPWSERLRYSARHAGYHGGASPQEVVVPIGVFVPERMTTAVESWGAEVIREPWWWNSASPGQETSEDAAKSASKPSKRKPRPAPKGQAALFVDANETPPAEAADRAAAEPRWLSALLKSELFGAQKKAAQRMRPDDEMVRSFLLELNALGGAATFDALRERLGLLPITFNGMLSLMPRLLNVDGFPVIEVSPSEKTVRLDRVLLAKQFGVEESVQ